MRHSVGSGFSLSRSGYGQRGQDLLSDHTDGVTLLFSDVAMPGDSDGCVLTHYFAEHEPWIEIVIASGNVTPCPGDMPGKATCIGKPFGDRMLQQRLTETQPDNKQLEQLKHAA
jgi:hypothetical protein